jgi:hypothetical protein
MFRGQILDVRRDQWLQVGLWGLVLVLVVGFVRFGVEAAVRPSHGFVAYYTAAQLVREGADASEFYDDAWFKMQVARFNPAADDIYSPNPPTAALMLLPLTGLDYTGARIVWTLFSLLCLIGAGGWLLWLVGLHGAMIPGFLALALLFQPIYANFHLGQVYVLLLGLLVLAWYGYRQGNDLFLGLALGLMFVLKTACAPLWLLLAIAHRWRALAWATATVLLVVVGSLPWLETEAWRTYLRLLAEINRQPWLAVSAYQTQLSLWRHLFSFDVQWNPAPLFPAPLLGVWLPWLTLSVLLVASVYRARTSLELLRAAPAPAALSRMKRGDLAFASFVILSIILSPVSLDYHYVFLLMPIVILFAQTSEQPNLWARVVLAVAVFLIAADLPYRSPRLEAGAWALLAYPKLYGAVALWGLALTNDLAGRGRMMKRTLISGSRQVETECAE